MKYRISLVSYLNSVPLGWGFTDGPDREAFEVVRSLPSVCADQLRRHEADVSLIPSIEYPRVPELKVIPGIAIASKRKVESILLIAKRPIDKLRSVAIDTSSRTSVALLNVLLSHFYKLSVHYAPCPPRLETMLVDHDGALIIGDPALQADTGSYPVIDLVEEWRKFTGKPFVFAFWAVRPSVALGHQRFLFESSKRLGLANLETIARRYSEILALPSQRLHHYLTESVNYDLDEENLSGLREFYRLAHQLNILEKPSELRFYD